MKNKSIKYGSIFVIFSILSFSGIMSNYDNTAQYAWGNEQTDPPYVEILYSVDIGPEQYLIHYNVCAGEKAIQNPKILLESNYETIQFESTKLVYAHSCFSYESQIHAKYLDQVKIRLVE